MGRHSSKGVHIYTASQDPEVFSQENPAAFLDSLHRSRESRRSNKGFVGSYEQKVAGKKRSHVYKFKKNAGLQSYLHAKQAMSENGLLVPDAVVLTAPADQTLPKRTLPPHTIPWTPSIAAILKSQ